MPSRNAANTIAVGTFPPNGYGLYDAVGNARITRAFAVPGRADAVTPLLDVAATIVAGGKGHVFTLHDASHALAGGQVAPAAASAPAAAPVATLAPVMGRGEKKVTQMSKLRTAPFITATGQRGPTRTGYADDVVELIEGLGPERDRVVEALGVVARVQRAGLGVVGVLEVRQRDRGVLVAQPGRQAAREVAGLGLERRPVEAGDGGGQGVEARGVVGDELDRKSVV